MDKIVTYRKLEREKKDSTQKVLKTSGKNIEKWDNSHRRFRTFISDSTASFCLIDFSGSIKFTYLIPATSSGGKIALMIQMVA